MFNWLKNLFTATPSVESTSNRRTASEHFGTNETQETTTTPTPKLDSNPLGTITNILGGAIGGIANKSVLGKVVNGITGKNITEHAQPVINEITGNTPSQEEQYKDTSNDMLLDFFRTQEETRQKELQEAYAREDEIRKETQEREDNAYQRMVADMRKAGINPNLVAGQPASSGGGITSASRTEQILGGEIASYTQIINALIEKDTTIEEGEKNRILGLIQSAGQIFAFSQIAKK